MYGLKYCFGPFDCSVLSPWIGVFQFVDEMLTSNLLKGPRDLMQSEYF